jgi:hypothetical protein
MLAGCTDTGMYLYYYLLKSEEQHHLKPLHDASEARPRQVLHVLYFYIIDVRVIRVVLSDDSERFNDID